MNPGNHGIIRHSKSVNNNFTAIKKLNFYKFETIMSYCGKCGTQLSEGTNFCPKCGVRVSPITSDNCGKSPSRKIVIPLIVSILILAIAGGGWYLLKNLYKDYSLEGLAKAVVTYDNCGDFHEGMAEVTKDGKIGFIDMMGNEVIPCIYDPVEEYDDVMTHFSDGLVLLCKGDHYVYINKKGEEAFPFNYDRSLGFSEGFAVVEKDGKYGIIDVKGKEVVPCIYDYVKSFSDGMAAVIKDEKYGFIDSMGNLKIPISYDVMGEIGIASDFHEGFAQIVKNDKTGYIDKNGKEVIPCRYSSADFFCEGLAVVAKDDKFGYIDTKGKEVISCEYDFANSFSEGLALVKKGGKSMFIDKKGKKVLECDFDYVSGFMEGLACITKSNDNSSLMGFIDKKGNEIIPCIFEGCSYFSEGLVAVTKDGINGYVDKKGKTTFDIENEEVKKLVQKKIKEKEEEEERERKRIEEENKPCNKFYNLASLDLYVWEARKHYFDVPGIDVLYFYPINKTEGYVSITRQEPDHKSWYPTHSLKTSYRIIGDNSISFSASGLGGLSRKPWSTNYNMIIEVWGNEIRLVNHHSVYGQAVSVTYSQRMIPLQDPLR